MTSKLKNRKGVIERIFEISSFPDAFDQLETDFIGISKNGLSSIIVEAGIIPEIFDHDSSEEKLWSKYSDIILTQALRFLGFEAEVIRTRGNSADVYAKADGYTLVGDAKCFRLSRTAKNQKDFKIKALDDWRKTDTYAVLVSPLYQYPVDKSQIYSQSISQNVTLLSYTHLKLLLDHTDKPNLKDLWLVGATLAKTYTTANRQRGSIYWSEIDKIVSVIAKVDSSKITEYKILEINKTKEIGLAGISYWKDKIKNYHRLSKEEAIDMLIHSQKIENKIQTIERAINRDYVI